ncbi:MAG TPA: tetratricopeptide repeat protein [Fibrobacteraceae bacterium]|nr:tetratricopeptide repeat protein [Fibrobacteraceae bacterium]
MPLLVLVFVLGLGLLVFSSIRIHFQEMEVLLQRGASMESGMGQMYLAAKFITQLRLYRKEISRKDADKMEWDLLSVPAMPPKETRPMVARNWLDGVNVHLINGMRILMGQKPLPSLSESPAILEMELAFWLERKKDYAQALTEYESVLSRYSDLDLRTTSMVELHKGFCYAMLGRNPDARACFHNVLQKNARSDLGAVAALLMDFMDQIAMESTRIQESGLARAEKLTDLFQCDEALKILKTLKMTDAKARSKALYLEGRCAEEQGNQMQAAKAYLKSIEESGASAQARDANRRLFLVGAQGKGNVKLQAVSAKLNETLKDSSLMRMSGDSSSALMLDTSFHDTLSTESIEGAEQALKRSEEQKKVIRKEEDAELAKHLFFPQGEKRRITTQDGQIFSGEIISDPKEQIVRIRSMVGIIGIPRKDIRSVEPF